MMESGFLWKGWSRLKWNRVDSNGNSVDSNDTRVDSRPADNLMASSVDSI